MRIGVLVATQGKRPNFMTKCKQFIASQTRHPDCVEIVDDYLGEGFDLTARYEIGLKRIMSQCDLVVVFEDDDFYSPWHIQTMVDEWERNGRPDLIGCEMTTYYHLAVHKYWVCHHPGRASLMATGISTACIPGIDFGDDPGAISLDMKLWRSLKGHAYSQSRSTSLGIKHGLGLCAGIGHDSNKAIYVTVNEGQEFLRKIVGEENLADYNWIMENKKP